MRALWWLALTWVVLPVQAALQIDSWQTPKGARVFYAHAPELPMVDVRLAFDAGSARDGEAKGRAWLTSQLIGMGSVTRDEEAFSDAMESLGVSFSTQSLKDMAVVSLRSLTRAEVLQPALQLAADALAQPAFQSDTLAREKGRLLTLLAAREQNPGLLASERFWEKLYGNHPYASPSNGRVDGVKALTPTDLRAFHQQYYVARNAVVAIVGAVSRSDAEAIAVTLADALPSGAPAPALPAVVPPAPGLEQVNFVATQTQMVLGQLGVSRTDADYPALYLANHILGGSGFASRLMEEVREKRGLVYGVSSALLPMRERGPWMVSLKTANANAPEALKVVQETVLGLLEDIPQSELDAHKDNIIGGHALETDSNKDIVAYLAMMGFYGLPTDYLASFPDKIRAVSREQLLAVVRAHLKPQWWTGVMLGQPAQAGAAVQKLPVPAAGGHH